MTNVWNPTPWVKQRPPMRVSEMALVRAMEQVEKLRVKIELKRPELMPGVIPASAKEDEAYVAMDDALNPLFAYANQHWFGMGFMGYPYLSELTQISEYRSPVETLATEMTRNWIKLTTKGDGDKADKLAVLEEELKRHNIQALFKQMAIDDGFFGRGQLYIDMKDTPLDSPLRGQPLIVDKATIKKGSLLGFRPVEALWTSPNVYNSIDPTSKDFFKPNSWFVMGNKVHSSRLLMFIGRPVPDMLKPAYNFGGLSMSQLMQPYVDNWLRTRQSVSDLIHSFSLTYLATDMGQTLQGGSGDNLFTRLDFFNKMRDNRGIAAIDKESEEFQQINTPLSGLSELQAQAQEHMAAPCHLPLIKLFGITPSGLNATSDGEIETMRDYIHASQESQFTAQLRRVLMLIQLDVFGAIDDDIGFEFNPLDQLDSTEESTIRKTDADTDAVYVTAGVVSPDEVREKLSRNPSSGYTNLSGPAPESEPEDNSVPPGGPDDDPDKTDQDGKANSANKKANNA